MRDLSIIIPALNEPTAPGVVRELYRVFGRDTEIIVVNKSSRKIENELRGTGAKVVEQFPLSYESALMQGFRIARGRMLATLDADGTYDPKDLKRAVDEIRKGRYGFVSAARVIGRSKAMTHTIRFGNSFLTKMFNILYRQKMLDVLSGSFVITREAFDYIRHMDPYRAGTLFFEIEIARRGYRTENVVGSYKPRMSSSKISKFKPFYGLTMAYHAIRSARDYNPLLIFGSVGLIAIIAGLVIGVFVFINFLHTGTLIFVGRALVAFMLIVLGFVSVVSGLILDLLLGIEKRLYRMRRE